MSTAASRTAEDTLAKKSQQHDVVSGGHLVARALKNEGVDTIFTLCGGHIIDIYDGCVDEGIRVVDVRHEQVAAHAADGYARQTGRLGCVVTTAGPGCTNAVTGVATAFRSESPILHIGGQGALDAAQDGFLAGPAPRRHHVAHYQVRGERASTERVADMISMAARECFSGAPGPSYLEIPRDVLDREVDLDKAVIPARATTVRRPNPSATRPTSRSWPTFSSTRSARHPARQPGLDLSRAQRSHRAGQRAQHSRLLQRCRARAAAPG